MKKRLFGLALVLALCLTLLCVSALASSDSLGLWVGGEAVTSENASNIFNDTDEVTASYDAATKTLTLNGATLSGSHNAVYFTANIYAKNDLNIVLEGSNSIGSGGDCAILAESDLKISGSGSLTCGSENDAAFEGHGIYCSGDLKVERATLNFYVKNGGIYCWNGDVELNNTNINIESKSETSDCISGNNITITGGEVTLVSNGKEKNSSNGIRGYKVEICGGATVNISAYDCGIYSSEALKVTGDNTNLSVVSMEDASEDFLAISAPYISVNDTIYSGMLKKLVVESGVVMDFTVFKTPTKVYVNGVNLLENEDGVPGAVYDHDTSTLTLTNVDLSVSYEDEAVICADGDLNIVLVGENKVTANGNNIYGIWIYESGSLFISGDSLTVISNDSKAIDVDDNACIASGKLIAAGYTEGIDIGDDLYVLEGVEIEATSTTDYGIETGDDLIVYGGEITAVNESDRTAMDIDDNMKVYGGSIIATNKSGGRALDIDVDLLVYGGSIVATGEEYGIDVAEDFNIEGGTVSATATGTNGAALRIANNIDDIRTIGANGALTLNAATPVWNDGSSPWLQKNNGKLTVYVDSVEEIDQFLNAGGTLGFVLRQDITGTVTIPAGADVTISGEHKFTGQISCAVAEDAAKTTKLTLDGLTLDGGGTQKMAVISQDQESKTVSGLDLSMNGCTVKNYTDKAVYLTNATALSIDGCTFTNNATGDMDKPNTKGDYTIDLNLVSVKAGELSITDSSFNGLCGDKAVIKVAARGGASDADASDISGSAATVEKLTVSGCTFSAEDSAADLNIGTDNKSYSGTGDIPANSTGSFAVSVSGNTTEVKINEAFKTYKNEDGNYIDTDTGEALQNTVVAVGESATKTDTGELEVKPDVPDEPDEPDEPDIPDLPVIPDIPVVTPPAPDDEPDDVQPAENPYTDVAEGAWYYDVVMQASEAGLMKGVTDTEFEPNGTLTRAMFWTILARAGGVDTDGGATWYAKAQAWAMENGVSDGTDAMGALTREQLATMLWRFAGEPTSAYSLSAYTDASSVSDYAETAMAWAVEHGIITGMTDTTIEPQGTATRAQCAAMLMRFIESVA